MVQVCLAFVIEKYKIMMRACDIEYGYLQHIITSIRVLEASVFCVFGKFVIL